MNKISVGTKVKANRDFSRRGVRTGEVGFVYEIYKDEAGIIFQEGAFGRFSIEEQAELEILETIEEYANYRYTGIVDVYADYMFGHWKFKEQQNG